MRPIADLTLGWQTELIFHRFDAEVIERDDCIVVRTPHNPTYYWGNCLLFDRSPREGDAARWLAVFDDEIASRQPEARHLAFGIDGEARVDLPADFAALGVTMFSSSVLTMRSHQLRAPRRPLAPQFSIRPLRLPDEAAQAVQHQVECDAAGFEPAGYRLFRERQMRRYGCMAAAGRGGWFGIFAGTPRGEHLVADCGMFSDRPGTGALGRFQLVSTHPDWRRRGLCTALIHAVCRHGFEVLGLNSLVIVADPDDVAIELYESLGFERTHSMGYLERRPPMDRAVGGGAVRTPPARPGGSARRLR